MDDEDDPFDDPFDNLPSLAVHETTSEDLVSCDAVDVDGGENHFGDRPSAGVPTDSTVTVRIAGKFIRRHDESLVRIKLSEPPAGLFGRTKLELDSGWPRAKAVAYAWIRTNRVQDLINGSWEEEGRRFIMVVSKNQSKSHSKSNQCWSETGFYFCECGPDDCAPTDAQYNSSDPEMRLTKRRDGRTKKCGCPMKFSISVLNAEAVQVVSPSSIRLQDIVRVSWDPSVTHSQACEHTLTVSMTRYSRSVLQRLIAAHPTYSSHKIRDVWRSHVKNAEMDRNGWTVDEEFHAHAEKNTHYLSQIDFNVPVSTINNIRENVQGSRWKYNENEVKSLFRLIAEKAGSFVIKFKAMELLDDPLCPSRKMLKDMAPCAWCETQMETADDLYKHMLTCALRDLDWTDEKVREWCESEGWRASHRFEQDSARLNTKAAYCEEMAHITESFIRTVHASRGHGSRGESIKSVMSPAKGVNRLQNEGDDGDDSELQLETALRFLQGTQQDWNLRRLPYVLSKACSDRVENALTGVLSLSEKDQLVGLIRPPFAAQVTRESLQTLAPNVRLNDCIINYFMAKNNLLQARRARVEKLGAPVVHCASSHFFTMLKTNGYSHVQTWSTGQRGSGHPWLASRYIYIPLHVHDTHWSCGIIDVLHREVVLMDSLNIFNEEHAILLIDWVLQDGADKGIDVGTKENWRILYNPLPQEMKQVGEFDCGLYVICFARELCLTSGVSMSRAVECTFQAHDMKQTRLCAAHEILSHGVQERLQINETVAASPRTLLQEVVDIKSPSWKKFYRENTVSKLPRVRIKQGNLERQMIVYQPFVLILMTPSQARLLWRFGHKRGVQMDSTFNITRSKFSTFTLIVRHDHGFYIPGAFFITSDERQETISYCLRVIRDKLKRSGEDWCPSAFMTDCCWAETNAIHSVFRDSHVLWCQFHVLEALQRNITSKLGDKSISSKERQEIMTRLRKLVRDVYPSDAAWDADFNGVLQYCANKQSEIDKRYGDSAWKTWVVFAKYLDQQWGPYKKMWAKHFRVTSDLTYGTQETTGSIESFHGRWKASILADGKGNINGRRMDWLVWYLEHDIIPRYCDKVCEADTSLPFGKERKARLAAFQEANLINEGSIVDVTDDDRDSEEPRRPAYDIVHAGETHRVRGFENFEELAIDHNPSGITCTCSAGRNGAICAPKVKAMLLVNESWTYRILGLRFKIATDHPAGLQNAGETHRGSNHPPRGALSKACGWTEKKMRWGEMLNALSAQIAVDSNFMCEDADADYITETIAKLTRFVKNCGVQGHLTQRLSQAKSTSGATRVDKLLVIPVAGRKGDTTMKREKSWHEKMVNDNKRKREQKR